MSYCWNQNIKYLNKKRLTHQEFDYLVNNYYNQYYATEADTQRRRQLRNLNNNNKSIALNNKNPFIGSKGQTFFFYMNTYTYKYIVYQPDSFGKRKVDSFVFINSTGCFCPMGCFELEPNQTLAQYVQLCYESREGGPPYFIKNPPI